MACTCAPALIQLRNEFDQRWPKRDKASDGCCASSTHSTQNPTSDHEPGAKGATPGYAHAFDFDEDLDASTHSLMFLVPILLRDSRCKYIIYEKQLFYPDGTVRAYTGINPHDKHLHLSILPGATFDKRLWLSSLDASQPTPTPSPTEDIVKLFFVRHVKSPKVYLSAPGAKPRHVERFNDFIGPTSNFVYAAQFANTQIVAPPPGAGVPIKDKEGVTMSVWVTDDGPLFGLSNETGEPL